jgi:chromosomal replication initiator protein
MSVEEEHIEHWQAVKDAMRVDVGEPSFTTWIAPLELNDVNDGQVTLEAPTSIICDRVQTNYDPQIRANWKRTNPDIRSVKYRVCNSSGTGRREVSSEHLETPRQMANAFDTSRSLANSIELDKRFVFDRFVVGRPNEFACAAAKRVAEDPSTPFNPLFLHGNSGLGKTHLLHSIAWCRNELYPDHKVLLISAETFISEFLSSLRGEDTKAFKDQLRSVDMLIIDDVQYIIGKNRTQEEFFHTFNALADRHRQIVLSADRSPTELDGLPERLRSRLGWGLVADLHPTDYELRLGILESKAEIAKQRTQGLQIDAKLLDFLARRILSDVRTLEGALNRLCAIASISGRALSIEMAQRELQEILRASDRKVSVEEIQRKVAEHFNIRMTDMYSARRSRSVARPRQVAMYLCKQLTGKSLPDIGHIFGGRDHTTVMHAIKRVTQLREIDSAFDEDIERLRRSLEG